MKSQRKPSQLIFMVLNFVITNTVNRRGAAPAISRLYMISISLDFLVTSAKKFEQITDRKPLELRTPSAICQ